MKTILDQLYDGDLVKIDNDVYECFNDYSCGGCAFLHDNFDCLNMNIRCTSFSEPKENVILKLKKID
jgi:hypothetical protein